MFYPRRQKQKYKPFERWNETLTEDESELKLLIGFYFSGGCIYIPEIIYSMDGMPSLLEILNFSLHGGEFNILFENKKYDLCKEVIRDFIEKLDTIESKSILRDFFEVENAQKNFIEKVKATQTQNQETQ